MSDEEESASAREQRRGAALISTTGTGGYQLTIDGLTPPGQAIEVESFSWGAAQPVVTGATAGKVQVHDLKIVKFLDKTSPLLFQGVALGKHYPRATLRLKRPSGGEAPAEYMVYTLEDALITSVEHNGKNPDVPTEQVTLAFGRMTHAFSEGAEEGKTEGATEYRWDRVEASG